MTNEVKNVPELRFPEFDGEWEEKQLSTILEIGTGKSKVQSNESGKYNILGSTGIIGKSHTYDYEGDFILTARVGHYAGKLYKHAGKVNISDNTIYLFNFINKNFIYESLNVFKLEKLVFGSGQPLIKASDLKKLKIRVPVSKEQKKIGVFLSKLDQQIELEKQKLTLLEKQKKGYMQQIFSQELRFKDENGNEYPKWEEGTIKSLVHGNISDGNWIEKEHISKTGKYRIIQTGNIGIGKYLNKENNSKFINQKDYDELKANEIYSGDILISRLAAPAGRSMIMPDINWRMVTSVDVAIIRPNKLFDPYFLMSMLNTDKKLYDISKFVSGSSHKRISRKNLEKIKLISPEIREQQKIGDFFRKIDELIEKQNQKIDGLKERKKGFLQKMFV